jgi:hypothetical protein
MEFLRLTCVNSPDDPGTSQFSIDPMAIVLVRPALDENGGPSMTELLLSTGHTVVAVSSCDYVSGEVESARERFRARRSST